MTVVHAQQIVEFGKTPCRTTFFASNRGFSSLHEYPTPAVGRGIGEHTPDLTSVNGILRASKQAQARIQSQRLIALQPGLAVFECKDLFAAGWRGVQVAQ
jgi:hypothetical protein